MILAAPFSRWKCPSASSRRFSAFPASRSCFGGPGAAGDERAVCPGGGHVRLSAASPGAGEVGPASGARPGDGPAWPQRQRQVHAVAVGAWHPAAGAGAGLLCRVRSAHLFRQGPGPAGGLSASESPGGLRVFRPGGGAAGTAAPRGLWRAVWPAGPGAGPGESGAPRHRPAGRRSLHRDQRRRAAAHPDGPGHDPGRRCLRHGRTRVRPGLRQPDPPARTGGGVGRSGVHRLFFHPFSGSRLACRPSGGAAARRRRAGRRSAGGGHQRGESGRTLRRGGPAGGVRGRQEGMPASIAAVFGVQTKGREGVCRFFAVCASW